MPAGIDTSTGQAAVFVVGEPAWHRMGRRIDRAANSADAIRLAGLDWDVVQLPVYAHGGDNLAGEQIECPGRFANVRSDTKRVLGIVSDSYRVFQNREAFDFMDEIVGDRLAMYETAGALDEGRRVWMLARIPKEYRAGDGGADLIKPYVLLTNSHDGSLALRMFATSIRVVCQNTLNLALSKAGSEGVTIYHFGSLRDRVREARTKLGIITARFDQFDEELHALIDRDLSAAEVESYFDGLLPKPEEGQERARQLRDETIGDWRERFENPRQTLPGIRGTAWAAYNAVGEWADHGRRLRGANEQQRLNSQLKSIWFGAANRIKQRAYASALELAGASAS